MFYENEYQEYLHATGRHPSTCRVHRYSLKRLIEFLETRGVWAAKTVTINHLEAFALELTARDYDVETRANHMMRIRIYFAFLEKQKHIFISPAVGLRMPRGMRSPAAGEIKMCFCLSRKPKYIRTRIM